MEARISTKYEQPPPKLSYLPTVRKPSFECHTTGIIAGDNLTDIKIFVA